jgi:hypothetical protein
VKRRISKLRIKSFEKDENKSERAKWDSLPELREVSGHCFYKGSTIY